ncbi:hypothetical protein OsJ_28495 [Oryza sativa Japonica Group]|uniref:Uncharacterized protein n=1 Tax=Oryza sativa subsp. japonica TaxID=39947 RepID=B9G298_ORYSJ|nr:hypothetical protein OsJ_28495 [Oryza sativa Japonica Group]
MSRDVKGMETLVFMTISTLAMEVLEAMAAVTMAEIPSAMVDMEVQGMVERRITSMLVSFAIKNKQRNLAQCQGQGVMGYGEAFVKAGFGSAGSW